MKEKQFFWILLGAMLFSRLPFLFAGYGVEEDSWGIALAAHNTHESGILEVSRFPGHPFQEIIYSIMWGSGPLGFNLMSTLFCMLAFYFLYKILKHYNLPSPALTSFAFSSVPVVFISSTYTIDYMWTIALVLGSYHFLLREKHILTGIFLGLAIACRITSGAFLLPFALILYSTYQNDFWKPFIKISVIALCIGIAFFIPVYMVYGTKFFMYYDQFPYPSLPKVIYKYSIGALGLIGIASLAWLCITAVTKKERKNHIHQYHLLAWLIVFILFTISYIRLPQKSGYMISAIPFMFLYAAYVFNKKQLLIFNILMISSSLLFSINLTDSIRGSKSSSLAFTFTMSGQEIFIDPISGPIFSDLSKRKRKMAYTDKVIESTQELKERSVFIAGWWYNEIEVKRLEQSQNENIIFEAYIDSTRIKKHLENSYKIYYLPEQNLYNDLMFGQDITDSVAVPFVIE